MCYKKLCRKEVIVMKETKTVDIENVSISVDEETDSCIHVGEERKENDEELH